MSKKSIRLDKSDIANILFIIMYFIWAIAIVIPFYYLVKLILS